MRDLQGKTVLLTGASTGLGPHIARRLRRGGAKLVLSARNREALGRLAAELGGADVVAADLRCQASRKSWPPQPEASTCSCPTPASPPPGAWPPSASFADKIPAGGETMYNAKREIDVVPIQLRTVLKVQALNPGVFATTARWMGATRSNEDLDERQRDKR